MKNFILLDYSLDTTCWRESDCFCGDIYGWKWELQWMPYIWNGIIKGNAANVDDRTTVTKDRHKTLTLTLPWHLKSIN